MEVASFVKEPVETYSTHLGSIQNLNFTSVYSYCKTWNPQSLSPTENELEMIYAVLKIDDKDSIDIVEFQAIGQGNELKGKKLWKTESVIYQKQVRRLELRRQNNSSLVLKDATASIDLEKYRGYNRCKRFLTATGETVDEIEPGPSQDDPSHSTNPWI